MTGSARGQAQSYGQMGSRTPLKTSSITDTLSYWEHPAGEEGGGQREQTMAGLYSLPPASPFPTGSLQLLRAKSPIAIIQHPLGIAALYRELMSLCLPTDFPLRSREINDFKKGKHKEIKYRRRMTLGGLSWVDFHRVSFQAKQPQLNST